MNAEMQAEQQKEGEMKKRKRDPEKEAKEKKKALARKAEQLKAEAPLPLQLVDGIINIAYNGQMRFFVFSADAVYTLRTRHRIVGSLVGGFPAFKTQNKCNGLPAMFLPEEIVLALEEGWVQVYDGLQECSPQDDQDQTTATTVGDCRLPDAVRNLVDTGQKYILSIPYESPRIHKVIPKEVIIGEILQDGRRKIRWLVYKDLWGKGMYITSGSKFGGTYLAYPDDPLLFHSHFIVLCVEWNRFISHLYFAAVGRLGVSTKKSSVLASIDPSTDEVKYVSLEWEGTS